MVNKDGIMNEWKITTKKNIILFKLSWILGVEFEDEAKETKETNETEEYSDYTEDEMYPNEMTKILGEESQIDNFQEYENNDDIDDKINNNQN